MKQLKPISNTLILLFLIILVSCKTTMYKDENVTTLLVDNVNYKFIKVEGGIFDMGCEPSSTENREDCDCYSSNKIENVKVDSFYIGKFLITYEQFEQFIRETKYQTSLDSLGKLYVAISEDTTTKSAFPKGIDYKIEEKSPYGDFYHAFIRNINWRYTPYLKKYKKNDLKYPVALVSIYDARAFCKWLSKKLNRNIRLLTDEEWEFAARGGNYSKGYCRPGTNDAIYKTEDLDDAYAYFIRPNYEIDARIPNELGIYGMNDGEFINSYYKANDEDPLMLILRGSTVWDKAIIRSEYGEIDFNVHFRVVMDISKTEENK